MNRSCITLSSLLREEFWAYSQTSKRLEMSEQRLLMSISYFFKHLQFALADLCLSPCAGIDGGNSMAALRHVFALITDCLYALFMTQSPMFALTITQNWISTTALPWHSCQNIRVLCKLEWIFICRVPYLFFKGFHFSNKSLCISIETAPKIQPKYYFFLWIRYVFFPLKKT